MTDVKAKRLRAAIEKGATSLDDATALTAVELYPVWVSGQSYDVDVRVTAAGGLDVNYGAAGRYDFSMLYFTA